ncbi:sugar efflux transporter [Paenibacillus sp. HN-1]|uniref:sugar efflux transporter n=1 Tax=Paenibacillus TaxID=44249 RepID=UPI001CA8B04F|nr:MULTISPECIES: sugar efflux transporter [Paenibacillus]MBY9078128.1 sugar efflux transporter [Paenibacillus sp. CGMCC 1.18879]MBY9083869.1 sugar efflux transporter [Paenibacillus sinensis]
MPAKRFQLFANKEMRILAISLLFLGIGNAVTAPFLLLFGVEELGLGSGIFGAWIAANSLCGILVNTLLAKRSDSGFDRKKLIILASAFSVVAYIGCYLVYHDLRFLLFVIPVFLGLGAPALPQIFAHARDILNQSSDRRNGSSANALLRSLFSAGFLIGPLVGTFLLAQGGYNALFLGSATMFLSFGVLVLLFLKRSPASTGSAAKVQGIGEQLKNRNILFPFLALLLFFASNSIYGIGGPLLITRQLQGSASYVGLASSICAGLEIVTMLFLVLASRRVSNRHLLILGGVCSVMFFVIVILSTQVWHILAAQFFLAVFIAIATSIGISYFQDLLPNQSGVATTLYSNAASFGMLLGNVGGGVLVEWLGYRNVFWSCLSTALTALVLFKLSKEEISSQTVVTERNQGSEGELIHD